MVWNGTTWSGVVCVIVGDDGGGGMFMAMLLPIVAVDHREPITVLEFRVSSVCSVQCVYM